MRRLVPRADLLDLADAYAGLTLPSSPWLALGMVGSVDGAVAIDGRSTALGGDGDLAAFRAVRSLADVVLVGASTAVAERYGASWPVRHEARRAAAGQQTLPELAVVSGSGRIDPGARMLQDPRRPPLLVTTEAGAARARAAGLQVRLLVVDATQDGHVDLAAARRRLESEVGPRIVCEGGPTLNAALLGAGLVDELFVTIAPLLVGADGPGLAGVLGPDVDPVQLTLHELRVHGSELLCRYRVQGGRYGPGAANQG